MRSCQNSMSFPLSEHTAEDRIRAVGCLLFSGLLVLASGGFGYSGMWLPGLLVLPAVLWVLWLGICSGIKSVLRIHLVPEGIAVTLFGRDFHRWPAEELKLFLRMETVTSDGRENMLIVSCRDTEQLAALREAQLRKGILTRHDPDYRKKKSGWQSGFAREYLDKIARSDSRRLPGNGLIVMTDTPECRELLEKMYPHVPTVIVPNPEAAVTAQQTLSRNKQDLRWGSGMNTMSVAALLTVFLPSTVLLFLAMPMDEDSPAAIVLSICSMVCLFGSMLGFWYFVERQKIFFAEEGIRICRDGRQISLLPASEIRTVLFFDVRTKYGLAGITAVSGMDRDEIRRCQEKRMEKIPRERERLGAYRLADCWQITSLSRYVKHRFLWLGFFDKKVWFFVHTPQREEEMRQRYPHAAFIRDVV